MTKRFNTEIRGSSPSSDLTFSLLIDDSVARHVLPSDVDLSLLTARNRASSPALALATHSALQYGLFIYTSGSQRPLEHLQIRNISEEQTKPNRISRQLLTNTWSSAKPMFLGDSIWTDAQRFGHHTIS
jgi:hypothetical protein